MIKLTRLNGSPLFVNCDQIKWAESAPDTMLTLMNGEKVVVLESCAEVVERVFAYRLRLLGTVAEAAPLGDRLASASLASNLAQSSAAALSGEKADSAESLE